MDPCGKSHERKFGMIGYSHAREGKNAVVVFAGDGTWR